MKYSVKVRYTCPNLKEEPKWVVVESDVAPELGVTDKRILPDHDCRKSDYSQSCDDDPNCFDQEILEIREIKEGLETFIYDESGFPLGK